MIDFEKQFGRPEYAIGSKTAALSATFKIVYGTMAAGLALSGVIAWYAAVSGLCEQMVRGGGFTVLVIAELAIVFVLTLAIRKLPVAAAYLLFIAYAALNGFTLSVVFLVFDLASIERVFFITAGMFGGLVLWGSFTRGDLSSIGSICGMALWGLVIAGIVNVFLHSTGLDWLCSFVGILVFTGLTMYDAQKIRELAAAERSLDSATVRKLGVLGALELYLDFVNLFLHILRFMGRRK